MRRARISAAAIAVLAATAATLPHALAAGDPPLVRFSKGMIARVNKASGATPTSQKVVSRPRSASVSQTARADVSIYPDCPLGMPGLGPWTVRYQRHSIKCTLAYDAHGLLVSITAILWPNEAVWVTTVRVRAPR